MSVEAFSSISQIWTYMAYALMLALLLVSCLKLHWPTKAKLILADCWLLGILMASYGILTIVAAPVFLHRAGRFSDALIFWFMAAVFIVIPPLKFRRYHQYYLKYGSS